MAGFSIISALADFSELAINKNISDNFTWTTGGAIRPTTGAETTSSYMQYSDYVDISGATLMVLSFMTWTSSSGTQANYGLAFYDSSQTYISGYQFPLADSSLGNSAGSSYELTIDIPDNAQYIRTTYHQDTTTYGEFSANLITTV